MALKEQRIALLLEQVGQLRDRYDGLHLKFRRTTAYLVGNLEFRAKRGQETFSDNYLVDLCFPHDYPLKPPAVKETGGRIARNVDHHVYPDGTLCLGPPLKVLREFGKNPTVLWFIEDILIPTLFWHTYYRIHPQTPLATYTHGDKGIREYREQTDLKELYFEIFQTNSLSAVLRFLEMIGKENTFCDSQTCPCNSGKSLGDCHGGLLRSVASMPYLKPAYLAEDYWSLKDKHRIGKK